METSIIIAILSSTTALIVAIISVIFNGRNQKNSALEIEKLRVILEEEKYNRDEERRRKTERINSIEQVLECSQQIKDSISILSNYLKFKNELTINSIEKLSKEIRKYSDLFSKILPKIDSDERASLHDIKKHLNQLNDAFAEIMYRETDVKNLDEKRLRSQLSETRLVLTDLQHELLVRKSNLEMLPHTLTY